MTGCRSELSVKQEGSCNILVAEGAFDVDNADIFQRAIEQLKESEKDCEADLSGTTYFDTECLKPLIDLTRCLRSHGKNVRIKVLANSVAARIMETLGDALELDWSYV